MARRIDLDEIYHMACKEPCGLGTRSLKSSEYRYVFSCHIILGVGKEGFVVIDVKFICYRNKLDGLGTC